MKAMNLPKMSTVKPKPKKIPNTEAVDENFSFNNHVNKNFNVQSPNQVWVSDTTYIKVNSSWVYLCVIIDLYARKLVSYSISTKHDTQLIIDCFNKASSYRNVDSTLIFHSDIGTQYTSSKFIKHL